MPAILAVSPFERIVSLLHDRNDRVIYAAIYALAKLAQWPEGAQAVITANTLAHLSKLFESSDANTRMWSCDLVRNVASHDTSMSAILEVNPFEKVVSLLHDGKVWDWDIHKLTYVLAKAAQWPEGAQAVITANALAQISKLFESFDARTRTWSCDLVGNLAIHETSMPAAPAILATNPFEKMVSLLHDENDFVIRAAIYALANQAQWSEGARAVITANTLAHLSKLLESSDANTRMWTCNLVGNLAIHETSMPVILGVNPFERIVSHLHDGNDSVIYAPAYALAKVARWPEGAQAVITANSLAHLSKLLKSSKANTRMWSCNLVGNLAIHETSMPAILATNPFETRENGFPFAAQWSEGAQAIITANTLAHLSKLLESSDADIRMWSCNLVGNLAIHETSMPVILGVNPFESIVSHLHDGNDWVIYEATRTYALANLAEWSEGAQAVITANALAHLSKLLKSSNAGIQMWSCNLVRNLAIHETSMPAILGVNPLERIVSLLEYISIIGTYTLS
ncbi:armadillo-type protein [Mycena pura]|uniref:Armadillo-type protein n=1 Tax=Mycena pura TaxID=153505 RepID=A0AAD6Y475_9AGAR|nr:armadillo-type protein [Mycena pura]